MVRLCIKQSVRAATETHATYFARGDKGREKGREGKGGGRAGKRRRWWREWKRQRKTRSRTRCLVVFQVGACVCVCPCPMLFLSVRCVNGHCVGSYLVLLCILLVCFMLSFLTPLFRRTVASCLCFVLFQCCTRGAFCVVPEGCCTLVVLCTGLVRCFLITHEGNLHPGGSTKNTPWYLSSASWLLKCHHVEALERSDHVFFLKKIHFF